jgi:hypothetical protein
MLELGVAVEPATLPTFQLSTHHVRIVHEAQQESDVHLLSFRGVVNFDRPDLDQDGPEQTGKRDGACSIATHDWNVR